MLLLAPSLSSSSFLYLYISLIGSVICSVICLRSWDLKGLVAYSSIVHIGIVTVGALSGTQLGSSLSVGIMIRHSLISPLIFSLASEFYCLTSSRCLALGHSSSLPRATLFFFCFWCGMNFGLPPSLPFWVELRLYSVFGLFFYCSLPFLFFSSYFCFLYCVFFYVLSCGGQHSSIQPIGFLPYPHFPSAFLVVVLPISGSCLLLS